MTVEPAPIYEVLRDTLLDDAPVALATVIEGPHLGAKLLVRPGRGSRSARSATPISTGWSPATPSASSSRD